MNEKNIIDALTVYDGTQESLEKTVDVFVSELGENWTEEVFQKLGGLSPDLKEKLNHAFNYYASLTAWGEAQSYLESTEPLEPEMMEQRMPVLKHWLDFFGEAGQNLYQQLETKFANQTENTPFEEVKNDKSDEEIQDIPEETQELEELDEVPEEEMLSNEPPLKEEIAEPVVPEKQENFPYSEDSEEVFTVKKALKMIQLLNDLQSWLASRCLELDNIETFAYPYYGLVVDLMRQTVKSIQGAEELQDVSVVNHFYEGGVEALKRKREAIESDIQVAVENCESDTTALIDKNVDLDQVKKTLGNLDESQETEYLGPAPDGFELMEEEAPLDEKAVKEQYQKLEEATQEKLGIKEGEGEKNTSQTPQNSVQRKLSFSLKPKKS